jgi:hypothetical protein
MSGRLPVPVTNAPKTKEKRESKRRVFWVFLGAAEKANA